MSYRQELLEGFARVAVASLSDALSQLGVKATMSHDIKPIFPAKVVGPAVTVKEEPEEGAGPPTHALEAIDLASPGSVIVIDIAEQRDVAVWGGVMTAGAHVRGLAGSVLDGGVRDVEEIRRDYGFPIFARSVSPNTTVGSFRTVARDVPIRCGGVDVRPGDLIVGDIDGVVVVPPELCEQVLARAREIEVLEQQTVALIKEHSSIVRAIQERGRV